MKRLNKHVRNVGIMLTIVLIVNIFAWIGPWMGDTFGIINWCDWYEDNIMPIIVSVFSRITNILPFSLGEILFVLAIILGFIFAVMLLTWIISVIFQRIKKREPKGGRLAGFRKFYLTLGSYVISVVLIIMTFNCYIMYHTTKLDGNLSVPDREYTVEELRLLRAYMVNTCNQMAKDIPRDENGDAIYNGDYNEDARNALITLKDEYPRLDGYYPRVKKLSFSKVLCQANMCGFFTPYTMEANCNYLMYPLNFPATYAHELSHLHGYIYEDEANYIAFRACINSDNEFIRYAGYLSVLNYVNNAYIESIIELDNFKEIYSKEPRISDKVNYDNAFLSEEVHKMVEETAIVDSKTVEKINDTMVDASLKANGVYDGMASYDRVTELLLQYYDGTLY